MIFFAALTSFITTLLMLKLFCQRLGARIQGPRLSAPGPKRVAESFDLRGPDGGPRRLRSGDRPLTNEQARRFDQHHAPNGVASRNDPASRELGRLLPLQGTRTAALSAAIFRNHAAHAVLRLPSSLLCIRRARSFAGAAGPERRSAPDPRNANPPFLTPLYPFNGGEDSCSSRWELRLSRLPRASCTTLLTEQ